MNDIRNKKRKNTAIDGPQGSIGDPGEHKNIHADGRCDQSDFHYSDHDDAEPNGIETQSLDGGIEDGNGQNDTGEYFQKHA